MKKILFIMLILLAGFVSAAPALTSLTLNGNAGTTLEGNVILSELTGSTITVESTSLISGSNTISASNIIITEISSITADAVTRTYRVRVNVASGQPSGAYTGTLRVLESGRLVTQSTLNVNVASNVTQGTAVSLTDVTLGSDNQERENTITGTLRIANTGTNTVTMVLTSNIPVEYQFALNQGTVTLNSGESKDIPVTLYIPDTQDSGRSSIGTIIATGEGLTKTATVYLETKSELTISRVRIEIDGDSETVSEDETVDAKAGDDVLLTVTVKNEFNDNIDIEDVEVEIESDNDLDWDENEDVGDVADDDTEEVEFSLSIDNDIDEDEYDVEVRISGEDENGAQHEDTLTFTVNIDKENHEITIKSATINPSRVSCDARTVTVRTNIRNTGSHDEDDVSLVVENEDLDVYEYLTKLELDEDDDLDKSFTFTVPKNTPTGEYIIHVTSYYDNDEESDEEVLSLFVDSCTVSNTNTTLPPTGNNGNNGVGTNNPIIIPAGTVGPNVGTSGFLNSSAYMIILFIAILLLLILIIILLVKFVF